MRELGSRGGKATVKKFGKEHFLYLAQQRWKKDKLKKSNLKEWEIQSTKIENPKHGEIMLNIKNYRMLKKKEIKKHDKKNKVR